MDRKDIENILREQMEERRKAEEFEAAWKKILPTLGPGDWWPVQGDDGSGDLVIVGGARWKDQPGGEMVFRMLDTIDRDTAGRFGKWRIVGENANTTDIIAANHFRAEDEGGFLVREDERGRTRSRISMKFMKDDRPPSPAALRLYSYIVGEVYRELPAITGGFTVSPAGAAIRRPVSEWAERRGIGRMDQARRELVELCKELDRRIRIKLPGGGGVGTSLLSGWKVEGGFAEFTFEKFALEILNGMGDAPVHDGLYRLDLRRFPYAFTVAWKFCVQHQQGYNERSRFKARHELRREVERVKVKTILSWTSLGNRETREKWRAARKEKQRIMKPLEDNLDAISAAGMGSWEYVLDDGSGGERTASRGELTFAEFSRASVEFTFGEDYPTRLQIAKSHKRALARKREQE